MKFVRFIFEIIRRMNSKVKTRSLLLWFSTRKFRVKFTFEFFSVEFLKSINEWNRLPWAFIHQKAIRLHWKWRVNIYRETENLQVNDDLSRKKKRRKKINSSTNFDLDSVCRTEIQANDRSFFFLEEEFQGVVSILSVHFRWPWINSCPCSSVNDFHLETIF